MEPWTKTKIKDSIKIGLLTFIKERGFKYWGKMGGSLYKKTECCQYEVLFMIWSDGIFRPSTPDLYLHDVEKILLSIIGEDGGGHGISCTVRGYGGEFEDKVITDEKIMQQQLDVVKYNFDTYYLPFFEKYSKLENVLELWDSLKTPSDKSKHFFGPLKYCRIIIISKLCKDELYSQRKQEYYDYISHQISINEMKEDNLTIFKDVVAYLDSM